MEEAGKGRTYWVLRWGRDFSHVQVGCDVTMNNDGTGTQYFNPPN
jgi:hypothetical protein